MCFKIVDVRGIDMGLANCRFYDGSLRRSSWNGESVARALLIYFGRRNGSLNMVTVSFSIDQSLRHRDAAAFSSNVTVRRFSEGLADSVGRQHVRTRSQFR